MCPALSGLGRSDTISAPRLASPCTESVRSVLREADMLSRGCRGGLASALPRQLDSSSVRLATRSDEGVSSARCTGAAMNSSLAVTALVVSEIVGCSPTTFSRGEFRMFWSRVISESMSTLFQARVATG